MLKIKILSIGKTKEEWLDSALSEYLKRLSPVATIDFCLVKNDEQLSLLAAKEPFLVGLDPKGKAVSSEEFSSLLSQSLIRGGSKLSFVIGGAEGLPKDLKKRELLISFSKMTFTHQICRLILVEQIYRAFEMQKGSKYHK